MAVEVKNLRIKVNVSHPEGTSKVDNEKKWSHKQLMYAMQQLVKNQKER